MTKTEADLLQIVDSATMKNPDKTRSLNALGNQEFEIEIEGWSLSDWRPRDEWFQIRYLLRGKSETLKLVFSPGTSLMEGDVSSSIDNLAKNEGLPIRIFGVSEAGGHAISSMFSIQISDINYL
ncbi:MAG: hypothetical protein AB2597_01985 [Candidatus Thiodiazotropha sp.]